MSTPIEIKKALRQAGIEVYRTRTEAIQLAERVRENLLMDAGITIHIRAAGLCVGFLVRAQRTDFPNEGDELLFERARRQAAPALERGYVEVESQARTVFDPGDGQRILDTWCEVSYEKPVPSPGEVVEEVRFVLMLEKVAPAMVAGGMGASHSVR